MANLKMDGLKARWERLSERERLLVGAGAAATFLVMLAVIVFLVNSTLGDLRDDNAEIRQALKDIEANREAYVRVRSKVAQVESRIGKGTVQLEGLLESAANASDVLISETTEKPPVQIKNTKYIERAVDLRIRKCTLDQLAKFLKKIETGPNLVVVTGLHARVRDDKHEDLEVEMTVSTWERAPDKKGGGTGTGGAGGGTGKEGKG
jgi:type II secretory pathway component PulM